MWGDGAGLGHVDGFAPHRESGRDDVAEGDQLADLAVARDPVHAVVVTIGHQEPATVLAVRRGRRRPEVLKRVRLQKPRRGFAT